MTRLVLLALAAALLVVAPLAARAQQPTANDASSAESSLAAVATLAAATPRGPGVAKASSADALLAALEDPGVGTVEMARSVRLPVGWGPVRLDRPVTVTSTIRAILDFCADGCGGAGGKNDTAASAVLPGDIVRFVVGPSGALSFHRVFLRNWIPPEGSPAADIAAEPEEQAPRNASRAPDYRASPLPGVRLLPGASLSLSLAAMHWTADALWPLSSPNSWWRRAADAGAIKALENEGRGAVEGPLVDDGLPRLHGVKGYRASYAPAGSEGEEETSVQMADCYMPFDVRGCMTRDAPFDEALVYCVEFCRYFSSELAQRGAARARQRKSTNSPTPPPPNPPPTTNKQPNSPTPPTTPSPTHTPRTCAYFTLSASTASPTLRAGRC